MSDANGDYSWLDARANDFKPEHAIRPGLEALADGDYDFEIVDAVLTTSHSGKDIINLGLSPNGGSAIQHTYWLENQLNAFGADCLTLGFQADKWGKQVPLSQAIPETLGKLIGVRFRGKKVTKASKDAGKVWHNLHINSRISGRPMPVFNEFDSASGGADAVATNAPKSPW
jgi:hypothetical protein